MLLLCPPLIMVLPITRSQVNNLNPAGCWQLPVQVKLAPLVYLGVLANEASDEALSQLHLDHPCFLQRLFPLAAGEALDGALFDWLLVTAEASDKVFPQAHHGLDFPLGVLHLVESVASAEALSRHPLPAAEASAEALSQSHYDSVGFFPECRWCSPGLNH